MTNEAREIGHLIVSLSLRGATQLGLPAADTGWTREGLPRCVVFADGVHSLSIPGLFDRQVRGKGNSMADYMILICENEVEQQRMAPSETKALVERHGAYVKQLKAAAAYRDSERLRPSVEGKRVHASKTEAGPFGDEQVIAGYYLVNADNLAAAVALAETCPMAPGDTLDVRPIMRGDVRPDKTNWQGKTFAFAVLGSASNEQAWVEVMDRIEAGTHDGYPDQAPRWRERFLGGVRLEAPSRGRHVVARGPKRMVMDGPFLEAKEVIGGIFFMRMEDVDEAVRWAKKSNFMRHGALEIRELWRS